MATRKLTVEIAGNALGASRAFSDTGAAASGFQSKLDKLSSGFKSFGEKTAKVGAVMTAGLTVPIAAGLKSAIDAASDMNETVSKTQVLFGGASKEILKWSEGTARALGQSRQTALDAAGTFGVFGKAAGLSGKDLAGFATANTKLASDMASFFNTSPQDAIEAIGAAFRGEAEPIRRYGVLLNDATLKAKAASLGLIKLEVDQSKLSTAQERLEKATRKVGDAVKKHGESSIEAKDAIRDQEQAQAALATIMEGKYPAALTNSQKVLAAQAAILGQTTDAQGDFGRTADGAANKQRIMAAQVEDLRAKIGVGLLPVWKNLLGVGQKVLDWFANLSPTMQKVGTIALVVVAALGPMLTVFGSISAVVGGVSAAFGAAATAISTAAAAAGVSVGAFVAPFLLAAAAVAALVAGFIYAYKHFEGFRNVVDGVVAWLRSAVPAAFDAVKNALVIAVDSMKNAWKVWGDDVLRVASTAWATVKTVVSTAIDAVRGAVQAGADVMKAVWQGWGDDIKRVVGTAFEQVRITISTVLGVIQGIFKTITSAIRGDWSGAWDGVKQIASTAINGIKNTIVNLGGELLSLAKIAFDGLKVGGQIAWNAGVAWVKSIPGSIKAAIGDARHMLYEIGKAVMEGFADGIKVAASSPIEAAKIVARGVKSVVKFTLGIRSPSKEFHAIGESIDEGFANGILAREESVYAAMTKVANQVVRIGGDRELELAARASGEAVADAFGVGAMNGLDAVGDAWKQRLTDYINESATRMKQQLDPLVSDAASTFNSRYGTGTGTESDPFIGRNFARDPNGMGTLLDENGNPVYADDTANIQRVLAGRLGMPSPVVVNMTVNGSVLSQGDLVSAVNDAARAGYSFL